ncbi:MAG: YfhO family protein, partial [Bacteroidales bacterium]
CLLGFYIALLIFGVNPWLSIVGAIAFAFVSYNVIIIAAGHNTKVFAIAYMTPIIAGIYLSYRGKVLLGAAITALFLTLQLIANHLQITYYTLIIVVVYGIVELIYTIKDKSYHPFLKATGILIIAAVLSVGSNFGSIWTTYEYGKYSMRGETELTKDEANKTSGLDRDYATDWSYGIDETLTFLIQNFKGSGSDINMGKNSAVYDFFERAQGPRYASQVVEHFPYLYWGSQPTTSGPVYMGAIIIFLFVLGIYILDPKIKWWLISATVLSIVLAWGKNFPMVTNFFLDYVPGYNKFRAVSMTLVIAQVTIPLMGLLALKKVFDGSIEKKKLLQSFKNSLYIVGGVALFFALLPGLFFDFSAESDQPIIAQGGQALVDAIREDRKAFLRQDAFRSLIFILLGAGVIWAYIAGKLKKNYAFIALGIIILVDLWAVDKRYLNDNNFVTKREAREPFKMTRADQQILQDKDPNFRVLNVTVNTFNDASTSYFHKSIGGYHGAKMQRYQDLIEYQISQNNMDVLNMLNTKYFIVQGQDKQPVAQRNPEALGNAWFVEDYRIVPDADAEIDALSDFNPEKEAIVDEQFAHFVQGKEFTKDTGSFIELTSYKPNHLIYNTRCTGEKLAVFSEIYYPKGWNVFIDDKPADHFRVNYVLRAMIIPEGNHEIEFKFEPKSYYAGNKISLASSIILLLLFVTIMGKELFLYIHKIKQED